MAFPLMPKATAVWLIENTTLTFEQIADFCGMHILEVKGIADGEVAQGIIGVDPVNQSHQLTKEEIIRCESNPKARLQLTQKAQDFAKHNKKQKSRYTPVARRQDKPDAVAWFLKHTPDLSEAQITKLIGTTKSTIKAVRERSHWNISNIKPRDPVLLGLCSQTDLTKAINASKDRPKDGDNVNSNVPDTKRAKK